MADLTRARNVLNWKAQIGFEEGMSDMFEWIVKKMGKTPSPGWRSLVPTSEEAMSPVAHTIEEHSAAAQVAMAALPFSTHTCFGALAPNIDGQRDPDDWKHTTCHFKNLYSRGGRWLYLSDSNPPPTLPQVSLGVQYHYYQSSPNSGWAPEVITTAGLSKMSRATLLQLAAWELRPTFYGVDHIGKNIGACVPDSQGRTMQLCTPACIADTVWLFVWKPHQLLF